MDKQDHYRFIHDLFEFNNVNPSESVGRLFSKMSDLRSPTNLKKAKKPRKLIVDVLAFCLMPNHYHLVIEAENKEKLIRFMRKLNIGYAKYFNKKYKRTGALFEGRYKSVPIETHAHFVHLPYYVHLNPLDMVVPEWRERKIDAKSYKKAVDFLQSYRWSSHLDYCGKKNFPSVTQREFLLKFFGGEVKYEKSILSWLKDMDLNSLDKSVVLDLG